MTTTLRVKFDGRVLVPQGPVDWPTGTELQVTVSERDPAVPAFDPAHPLAHLADFADAFPADPASPRDGAAQHDHYLYGTPKRTDP